MAAASARRIMGFSRPFLLSTAWFALCLALASATASRAQVLPEVGDPRDLTLRVSTDRPVYPTGAVVEITEAVCNETQERIRFHLPSRLKEPYLAILDEAGTQIAYAQADGGNGAVLTIEYAPGDCRFATYQWFQSAGRFDHLNDPLGPQVSPGIYRARTPTQLGWAGARYALSPPFGVGRLPPSVPTLPRWSLAILGAVLASTALYFLRR